MASLSPILVKIADFGISKRWGGTFLRTNCGTLSYQAPEQLGLLPRATGNFYTERVDIWALGAIVHQILTSEIPFLDKYHDIEDSTDFLSDLDMAPTNTSSSQSESMMDMGHLVDYCRDLKPFPTEILEKNGVSKDGIGFVRSLMIANPSGRVSAAEALKNKWLGRTKSLTLLPPKPTAPAPSASNPPAPDPSAPAQPILGRGVRRALPTELLAAPWQVPIPQTPSSSQVSAAKVGKIGRLDGKKPPALAASKEPAPPTIGRAARRALPTELLAPAWESTPPPAEPARRPPPLVRRAPRLPALVKTPKKSRAPERRDSTLPVSPLPAPKRWVIPILFLVYHRF